MITADIDICNLALDYCNVRNITSLDENTKASNKCKAWYDLVRQSLLINLNASFSIKRAKLVQIADYTPIYGYDKAYALPRDILQVLNINNPAQNIFYQIEGNYLYCNETDINIRYIADIKDVTFFDSEFCDCLALKLAEKICLPLTENIEKANYLKQLADQKYIQCSTKYGRDNRIITLNNPSFRHSKTNPFIPNCNYPIK